MSLLRKDLKIPTGDVKWISSRHFLRSERLTRGKLQKDISECDNESRFVPSKKRKVTNDSDVRVYAVTCDLECFPLLKYNCGLVDKITKRFQKVKHLTTGKQQDVAIPHIAQTDEMVFTVVTSGRIDEHLPLIVRKQNLNKTNCKDITGVSRRSRMIQEAKGSCCCLLFEKFGDKLDVRTQFMLRVLSQPANAPPPKSNASVMETDMTEKGIRKGLTDLLSQSLFSYAEEILGKLRQTESTISLDEQRLVEQAVQSANALLNRKITLKPSVSDCIPENVATSLKKLDGVLAFGLFSTGIVVIVDESFTTRRAIVNSVMKACSPDYKSPKVEFTSKTFLKPTYMKQGDRLTNNCGPKTGTLGMVANAKDNTGAEFVVGLTSGHYFEEGDNAEGFGQCIASRNEPDIAVIKAMTRWYSFNFYDENGKLCNCVPLRQEMKIDDVVYKRGAETDLTEGYIRSNNFHVRNSSESVPLWSEGRGYLVQGVHDNLFAEMGDSGSFIFTPDKEDQEKETVQIVSIQSRNMEKEAARKMNFPINISFTEAADKCFESLRVEKKIEINLPTKEIMHEDV